MATLSFADLKPIEDRPLEEVYADAIAKGARCTECPFYGLRTGPVLGEVVNGAKLAIVGEAPGKNELGAGRPFVGWSGQELEGALFKGGLERTDCSITNTILCMPPGGRFQEAMKRIRLQWKRACKQTLADWVGEQDEVEGPVPEPVMPPEPMMPAEACKPRLHAELDQADCKTLLAVGKQALVGMAEYVGATYGKTPKDLTEDDERPHVHALKKQHGAPIVLPDERVLMSSYHPAMTVPDKKEWLPVIRENLTRAAEVAAADGAFDWTWPVFPYPKENYFLWTGPSAAECVEFMDGIVERGLEIAMDLETTSADPHSCELRCAGIGREDYGYMVVPFRHMDGTPWWEDEEDYNSVVDAFVRLCNSVPLVGQNFSFDSEVLLRYGVMRDRQKSWTDVMLLHKNTQDNDLPHDLGFIARRFFPVPMWKADVDHKSQDNVDDWTLHFYCQKDVVITWRLLEPLRSQIDDCATWPQYTTDADNAPHVRNMGSLGLVMDEVRRGEFSFAVNWLAQKRLYEFHELIGTRGLNPRSVPQLQSLIYEDWGYRPVGEDDELSDDEDDWSTSNQALTELMRQQCMKPNHKAAMEGLLKYREVEKLRGTYTDTDNQHEAPKSWSGGRVAPAIIVQVWDFDKMGYRDHETLGVRPLWSITHSGFKQHVVPTGRLASGGPNLQNIPALGQFNMRDMYVAPPGYKFVGSDYAQLEARIYAVVAQDQILLECIEKGWDIHSMNAASLLAEDPKDLMKLYRKVEHGEGLLPSERKEFRKYWRGVAKRFCFLEIYGGHEEKLFDVMANFRDKSKGNILAFPNLTVEKVKFWHANWHQLHPETKHFHENAWAAEKAMGYAGVSFLDMRRRFFPCGPSRVNAVPNMKIQGAAGSIANRAFKLIAEQCPHRGWSEHSGLCLQVHDDIKVYALEADVPRAQQVLRETMPFTYRGVEFAIDDPGASFRWSKQA